MKHYGFDLVLAAGAPVAATMSFLYATFDTVPGRAEAAEVVVAVLRGEINMSRDNEEAGTGMKRQHAQIRAEQSHLYLTSVPSSTQ